jgi:hypothetical protein
MRFERAVLAKLRLMRKAARSRAAGGVSGFNRAKASKFDSSCASSFGSRSDCVAGGASTAGAAIAGLLVSRTIFSGHLCADLIRITALSMATDWPATIAGDVGRHHLAMNSKMTSMHPADIKYRAMGTACRSCKIE